MLSKERITAIVTTLFVWSLAGALFGGLFIGLFEVLKVLSLGSWQAVVVAAVSAGMTTAMSSRSAWLARVIPRRSPRAGCSWSPPFAWPRTGTGSPPVAAPGRLNRPWARLCWLGSHLMQA